MHKASKVVIDKLILSGIALGLYIGIITAVWVKFGR